MFDWVLNTPLPSAAPRGMTRVNLHSLLTNLLCKMLFIRKVKSFTKLSIFVIRCSDSKKLAPEFERADDILQGDRRADLAKVVTLRVYQSL